MASLGFKCFGKVGFTLLLLFVLGLSAAQAQQKLIDVFYLSDAAKTGVNVPQLEASHTDAVNMQQPEQAVFPGRETEVAENWVKFLQDLNSHLKENGFNWEGESRVFVRAYFGKDGSIDAIGLNRPEGLSAAKQEELLTHTRSFAKTYKFGLTADKPFVQCGKGRFGSK